MTNLIALVDCNNFFVSCERVFNPKFLNKPVVVLSSNDGCVVARSKEAKKLGVPMGAPAFQYANLFHAHRMAVLSSNFFLYGDMSERVMQTLASFSPDLEIYSIDEAFIPLVSASPEKIAQEMRQKVLKWTGIPVSIGLAQTKTLAKIANYLAKNFPEKEGVCVLSEGIDGILDRFPVEEVWGIGRKTAAFLKKHGIFTAKEFKDAEDGWIKKHLTVVGLRMAWELRGIRCFELHEEHAPKKSIMTSRSFGQPVLTEESLGEAVSAFTARAAEKLRSQKSVAHYLEVFIMTSPHHPAGYYANQARMILSEPSAYTPELITCAKKCLKGIFKEGLHYKKAGVLLGGIIPDSCYQADLFTPRQSTKKQAVMDLIDQMNSKSSVIRFAAEGIKKEWKTKKERCTPHYTTNWSELLTIRI